MVLSHSAFGFAMVEEQLMVVKGEPYLSHIFPAVLI